MITLAWAIQLAGLVSAGSFLGVYIGTVWQPWRGKRAGENGREAAARQLLLAIPVMLLALFIPGAINALAGHATLFAAPTSVFGKAVAVGLMWFPWRLYWKARP